MNANRHSPIQGQGKGEPTANHQQNYPIFWKARWLPALLLMLALLPLANATFTVPSGIVAWDNISLQNTQTSAIGNYLQVQIPVNTISLNTYIDSTANNIEFFYPNGTIANTWMLGNVLNPSQTTNLNTVANDIFFLRLNPSIGGSTTTTNIIAIGFGNIGANLLNNAKTGENPLLSPSYGQYDNGNAIFNFYDNFIGSSLNGNLWTESAALPTRIDYIVNNGITLNANSPLWNIQSNNNIINIANDIDFYGNPWNTHTGGILTGLESSTQWSAINAQSSTVYGQIRTQIGVYSNTGNLATSQTLALYTSIMESANKIGVSINMGSVQTATASTGSITYPNTVELINETATAGSTAFSMNWFDIRTQPPNDIMPLATFSGPNFPAIGPSPASTLIYLFNSTANPAITFNALGTTSSCTANFLGGVCSGTDVIAGTQALTGMLFITNFQLTKGSTLTTNGYAIVASGSFNSIGANIITGYLNNGGNSITPANGLTISLLNSYGGSGGGTQGPTLNGGNTLASGGSSSNSWAGQTPSAATVTESNVLLWSTGGFSNYLSGAGGAWCTPGSTGGGGAHGEYLQGNPLRIGTVNAIGGNGQGPGSNIGAGGGGGTLILASGPLGYTAGTYNIAGGQGGTAQGSNCGSVTSGSGGAGNVVWQSYTNPLLGYFTNQYYPIGLYNATAANTLYTLKQTFNGITKILNNSVTGFTYVPPPTQATGFYTFNITETNTISSNRISIYLNVSLNMTDIKSPFTCNQPVIQYFPNSCNAPAWTANPRIWNIASDNPSNGYGSVNKSNPNIDVWSNANLIFSPLVNLTYNNFNTFTANALNNPFIGQITQSKLIFTPTNTIPTFPNTRQVFGISTFDQQFLTPVNSLSTTSFNFQINNYSSSNVVRFTTNNSNSIWMPTSNFINPMICFTAISTYSSQAGYTSVFNNYINECQTSAMSRQFNIYLPNSNSIATTFNIYQNGGYGGYNDSMLIYTGISTTSLSLVQTYLIGSGAVPFILTLQNNQQYQFVFMNSTGSIVYTSTLTNWDGVVNINLPTTPLPVTQIINATASCGPKAYNSIAAANQIDCTGIDRFNYINQWKITILNITSILNTTLPIATLWFNNTSGFNTIYSLSRLTTTYYVTITGYAPGQSQTMWSGSYAPSGYTPLGFGGEGIIAIVAFLLGAAIGQRTKSLSIMFTLLILWFLEILQITNFGYVTLLGLTVTGIILVYIFESRDRGS